MKKLLFISVFLTLLILSALGQNVTNYTYVLDNGITVKTEHCWNHVWVQQTNEAIAAGAQASPIAMNIRTLGDLILPGSSSIKLLSGGKEVKLQGAAPGTYDLKITAKLSGKPGSLGFVVGGVVIKAGMKTNVSVTLYDYQVAIPETAGSQNGLSAFDASVICYKNSPGQTPYKLSVTFYQKGKHDAKVTPDEATSETKGKIKPGTYDVLLTIGISDEKHLVWLENFTLKPDVTYKISENLNAGVITYAGINKDIKTMLLYPSGTAAQQAGKAIPDNTREIISYDNVMSANPCRPGTFDILIGNAKGKYEWRKNIAITTGASAEVK
jgi:hypothetical protein